MIEQLTDPAGPLTRLMEWDSLVSIGAIFALLVLSAFFSGSETALTAASPARLHVKKTEDESAAAARALTLIEDRERLIGAILLGNNLVNILASAIATSLFLRLFGDGGVALATAVMTTLVLVFAEVLPKTYAILKTNEMAMAVSLPLRIVVTVLSPMVKFVQMLVRGTLRLFGASIDPSNEVLSVREELRGTLELHDQMQMRADAPAQNGTDDSPDSARHDEAAQDLDMVGAVLELDDLEVSEVMVHRKSIEMVNADQPPEVIVDEVLKGPHTRVPLYRGERENIIGVLHVKDLLRGLARVGWSADAIDVEAIAQSPIFVPETTGLRAQLNAFLKQRGHFALVVDEYGTLKGLITLEDIIEEIVGEILDEHDKMTDGIRPRKDGTVNVDGWVPIRDLNRNMGWRLPDEEATTIAGLVIHEAQEIPDTGQVFNFYDFKFEILRRQLNQITAIKITPPEDKRAAIRGRQEGLGETANGRSGARSPSDDARGSTSR